MPVVAPSAEEEVPAKDRVRRAACCQRNRQRNRRHHGDLGRATAFAPAMRRARHHLLVHILGGVHAFKGSLHIRTRTFSGHRVHRHRFSPSNMLLRRARPRASRVRTVAAGTLIARTTSSVERPM